MWGDHLCPRTVGQALCTPPHEGGDDCSWERRGEEAPPPPADMNIYNGSGFLLHPAGLPETSLVLLLQGEPPGLKSPPVGPLSLRPVECQPKPFFLV